MRGSSGAPSLFPGYSDVLVGRGSAVWLAAAEARAERGEGGWGAGSAGQALQAAAALQSRPRVSRAGILASGVEV